MRRITRVTRAFALVVFAASLAACAGSPAKPPGVAGQEPAADAQAQPSSGCGCSRNQAPASSGSNDAH